MPTGCYPRVSPEDRFWSKVKRTPDGCWFWLGYKNKRGYGDFSIDGVSVPAPRAALILLGYEMDSLCACHTCDSPPCVRPSHLFPATQKENLADMVRKKRSHGGKFTEATVARIRSSEKTNAAIAVELSVSPGLISQIRCGRIYTRPTVDA